MYFYNIMYYNVYGEAILCLHYSLHAYSQSVTNYSEIKHLCMEWDIKLLLYVFV